VPGNTEAERFDNAVRKRFTVSKEAILKAEWKRARTKKKRARKQLRRCETSTEVPVLWRIL
jgi:hypothetical protein